MELEYFQKEAAQEFAQSFESRTRDNGESFVCLKDDAPQWIDDAWPTIHGTDIFPDDWRYQSARWLACSLAETDPADWEEFAYSDDVNQCVDDYNGALLHWALSDLSRAYAGDERAQEIHPDAGVYQRLQYAQFEEASEIAARLVEAVTEEAESRFADWEEAQEAESDES